MLNSDIVILRARKDVPGIGRKLSRYFNANEVTCGYKPYRKVPDGSTVFNYGRSQWPIWYQDALSRGVSILNSPEAVRLSVDKTETLRILTDRGIPCIEWTDNGNYANDVWLNNGHTVFARTTTTGKQGKGIEIYKPEEMTLMDDDCNYHEFNYMAPLYTKAYNKTHEFRVHVFNSKVIDYVQKKRMGSKKLAERGLEAADENLRNHKRGWVFAHNDIVRSKLVEDIALATVDALGLDYAGIDVLATVEDGQVVDAVVCESNSAPGMSSPTTFKAYTTAIEQFIRERKTQ